MNRILQKIEQSKHIALIVHVNPDADSMGSASAFYSYILQIQKRVTLFSYTEDFDNRLKFIPWVDKIRHSISLSCDLYISFDCASLKRLGFDVDVDINLDHHKSNQNYAKLNYVDTDAISTTELIYNYFISQEVKINSKMATALYAGLVDESKNFMSYKSGEKTFEMAKVLLQKGADRNLAVKNLFQTSPLSLLRLKGLMFSNMKLSLNATAVVHLVTQEMLLSCGAVCRDCEEALEESLYLPSVSIAYLLCEDNDGSVKCSIRTDETVDASAICSSFGGEGHAHAAGCTFYNTTLQKADNLIKDILEKKK